MEAKLIKRGHSYALVSNEKLVAFTHPEDFSSNDTIGKLCLDNCQAIERDFDVVDHAIAYAGEKGRCQDPQGFSDQQIGFFQGYIDGFEKALELVEHRLSKETEWQVEIVMDICGDKVYAVPEPALDRQGCLILKRIDN